MLPTPEAHLLKRLRALLAVDDDAPGGGWMVQGRLPAAQLDVAVAGLGPLSTPLRPAELQALQAHSQPAPFGLREQTLVDPKVRDTGEIDASALTLTWAPGAEARLCRQIAEGLGLASIELRPHKLLIYGPGQFFKPHQDTARQLEMIGTLVLIWPSGHLGGELRVEFGDRGGSFSSQQLGNEASLRWCAFYADCRHEVLPVTEGHRIALSFEVRLPAGVRPRRNPVADPALVDALRALFGAGDTARQDPWYLLLDHQYSEVGLRWRALKGRDQRIAQILRAAAESAGFTVGLVLIEQMQVWNCAGHSRRDWKHGPDVGDFEDDDLDDLDDPADFDPAPARDDDLIDSSCETLLWLDAEDWVQSRERLSLRAEPASLRPFGSAHLVNSEYEGYMGNYGETMSYWYRRAALVLQSPTVALRLRYQTDPATAVRALAERAANPARTREVAEEIGATRDLLDRALKQQPAALFPALLSVAATLRPAEAAALLKSMHLASLGLDAMPALVRLQAVHGVDWLRAELPGWAIKELDWQWKLPRDGEAGAPDWPEPIDQCLQCLASEGLDPGLIRDWQSLLFRRFEHSEAQWRGRSPSERDRQRAARVRWIHRMLRALAVGDPGDPDAPIAKALRVILVNPRYRLPEQATLLAAAPESCAALRAELAGSVLTALDTALAEPPLSPDDHGLRRIEWTCRCGDCKPVIAWAESVTAAPLNLPLAEERRRHICEALSQAGVPIRTETLRQGRPYTLRCLKDFDAATRDAEWRRSLEAARQRLQSSMRSSA